MGIGRFFSCEPLNRSVSDLVATISSHFLCVYIHTQKWQWHRCRHAAKKKKLNCKTAFLRLAEHLNVEAFLDALSNFGLKLQQVVNLVTSLVFIQRLLMTLTWSPNCNTTVYLNLLQSPVPGLLKTHHDGGNKCRLIFLVLMQYSSAVKAEEVPWVRVTCSCFRSKLKPQWKQALPDFKFKWAINVGLWNFH